MAEASRLERLLKRERAITGIALAVLCVLAWVYTLMGAGLGMSAWDMTTIALFPHLHAPGMSDANMAAAGSTAWSSSAWVIMISMWWIMMIAMMTPSATPAILLFSQVQRHAAAQGRVPQAGVPIAAFAAGYAMLWLGFAIVATALHWTLERAGLLSAMTMQSHSGWLSGVVLIAAGIYQLSPLKNICLAHCHAPASFLARHWRPGAAAALRAGAIHGVYCVGCCWLLMALLFVGGVMNVAWIAALAVLVALEKVLAAGHWIARATGIALIAWGVATLAIT
jgi:predicted metal-binding membrane protein